MVSVELEREELGGLEEVMENEGNMYTCGSALVMWVYVDMLKPL
jgi:hypothetical protein